MKRIILKLFYIVFLLYYYIIIIINSMSDQIWTNDFNILFRQDRMMEFFPMKEQTHEERVNAVVRLSLYISILLAIYHSNVKFFAIFVFFLVFTSIIYRGNKLNIQSQNQSQSLQQKVEEKFIQEKSNPHLNDFTPSFGLHNSIEKLENNNVSDKCTKPTIDNPFMNVTMKDYMNLDENGQVIDRPPACDTNDPEIKKLIDESFNNNLYKDVSDVFGKMNSQRQFVTMPYTQIPNNQDEFSRWLYLNPKTCKEDQDKCLLYEDIRSKRQIMPNADRNPISSKKFNTSNNSDNQTIQNAGSNL